MYPSGRLALCQSRSTVGLLDGMTLWVRLALPLLLLWAWAGPAAAEAKRVLVVHSFGSTAPTEALFP
mgnify:CR=1 FL=1